MNIDQTKLWEPTEELLDSCELRRFMQYVNLLNDDQFSDYQSFYAWSVMHYKKFWRYWWDYLAMTHVTPPVHITEKEGTSFFGQQQWFIGSKLNYTQQLLKHEEGKLALIYCDEKNQRHEYTIFELTQEIAKLRKHFLSLNIQPGNIIAGVVRNSPEAVIAYLAAASIGAIWTSCSPDFGADALVQRLKRLSPQLFITVSSYSYKGKKINIANNINNCLRELTTIKQVINIDNDDEIKHSNIVFWQNITALDISTHDINYDLFDFNHPLCILFSSGTTGIPKCIMHRAGGVLLEHLKEHKLHLDIQPNDRVLFVTTCGWMMWNWLVSALAAQATIVLYEGAVLYPEIDSLFEVAATEKITHLGVGAKYLNTLRQHKVNVQEKYNLTYLRCLMSTGSALTAENFYYVSNNIKHNLQIASISGGSDIIGCFALSNPLLPVYAGELQCRSLAMDIAFYDEQGIAVFEEKGELVCKNSFPTTPLKFFNDDNDKQYYQAYFDKYNNVWSHGDYGKLTSHNGVIIYGRSDTTLNPGGVRIGSGEIYMQLDKITSIVESVIVDYITNDNQNELILFVVLVDDLQLNDDICQEIKILLSQNLSPKHVPKIIKQVPSVPRTHNHKLCELAVKYVLAGKNFPNESSLKNPEVLQYYSI